MQVESQISADRKVEYIYCNSSKNFEESLENVNTDIIGVDTETTGLDPAFPGVKIRLVQLCGKPFGVVSIFDAFTLPEKEKKKLKEHLESRRRKKIFHNAKFDLKHLYASLGIEIDDDIYDTMLASQLIAAGDTEVRHALDEIVYREFGEHMEKEERLSNWSASVLEERQLLYAATDTIYLHAIREKQIKELRRLGLVRVTGEVEFFCVSATAEMEFTGIRLDIDKWCKTADRNKLRAIRMQEKISQFLQPPTNSQQGLFAEMTQFRVTDDSIKKKCAEMKIELPLVINRKTKQPEVDKKGKLKRTISMDALEPIKDSHPLFPMIIKHATHKKAWTSYGRNWIEMINPVDGRIHTTFKQIGTETGRFCVAPETPVECPRDLEKYPDGIPISELKVGQFVYSFTWDKKLCLRRVNWIGSTGVKDTIKISLKGKGRKKTQELVITKDHLVRLPGGQWIPAGDLKPGKMLMSMPRRMNVRHDFYATFGANSDKYKVRSKSGNKFAEHRFIYAEAYGCDIPVGYDVHHKDEIKQNNSVENLELKLHSTHISEHRTGILESDIHRAILNPFSWKWHPKSFQRKAKKFNIHYSEDIIEEIRRNYIPGKNVRLSETKEEFSERNEGHNGGTSYRVIKIEENGFRECWDVEIDDTHTFIGSGVALHNSVGGLHQIPQEYVYRRNFIPDKGNILCWADYSQIELRILADITGDTNMIAAFISGVDLHTYTASQVFGVDIEHVTSAQRRLAKNLNFGIVYGIGAPRFAESAKISLQEAEDIIRNYFRVYRQLDAWLRQAAQSAVKTREARTVSGRLLKLNFDENDPGQRSLAERNGKNMPVQGSSADITKVAMGRYKRRQKQEGGNGKLINCAHDEIITECPENEKESNCKILVEEMVSAGEVFLKKVPVKVDLKFGYHWSK